jgi:glycosyltransferase involved in cell wall biosynthesis
MGLLNVLPPPPQEKKGWPWTRETKSHAQKMPNGEVWPRISIVTPSYNQGSYIEETIRSVLLQNYPNIEYIIIDGGSTDETVEIIRKYEPWLTDWVSEPDRGQSHAINKGFARCTGDIYNWLCSDDILLDSALEKVSKNMDLSQPFWLIGGSYRINENRLFSEKRPAPKCFGMDNFVLWHLIPIAQPSVFWNKQMQDIARGVNENFNFCMDVDLWYKLNEVRTPVSVNEYLSRDRLHSQSKTTGYSDSHADSIDELAGWLISKISESDSKKFIGPMVRMHKSFIDMFRIRNHVVFGPLMRLWKRFVNKDFPI